MKRLNVLWLVAILNVVLEISGGKSQAWLNGIYDTLGMNTEQKAPAAEETSTAKPHHTGMRGWLDKLTEEGEWAWDEVSGVFLPEEMDDGELEGGDHHITWTYDQQSEWAGEYPLCQGVKMRQSPIDIVTNQTVLLPDAKLEFINWDQAIDFSVKNTHHSVSVAPHLTANLPTVKLGWLPDGHNTYELQDIHFHWGDGEKKGSEHEINGEKAAAEMHMVHYKKGVNKTDIGNVEDSVLVIGVLIESDKLEHNKLEAIIAETTHVNGTDEVYLTNNPEDVGHLLPDNHNSFFTYSGSLTTPPCYEVVTWVVMSEPVYMSHDSLVELANIEAKLPDGVKKINHNNRDIQPLLDRPVYVSFEVSKARPTTMNLNNKKFKQSLERNMAKDNKALKRKKKKSN